jgi:aminopeptidase N
MKILLFLAFSVVACLQARASGSNDGHELVNVRKYTINLEINDTTNAIKGRAGIKIALTNLAGEVVLELASLDDTGRGMVVDSVIKDGTRTGFLHQENKLVLPVINKDKSSGHDTLIYYDVYYHGIPDEGLIISRNMYGQRTFFAENWPNRAHHWFPCTDHPSVRSTVDFIITAPSHYQVIATGIRKKTVNRPGGRITHYWSSAVPVPTKVMVFAAARFAVEYNEDIDGIPYSNWVYPENMEEGFFDFQVTPDILRFFTRNIGPYPFEKIANVQSTTRFGGMENAGNIFYHEKSITGNQTNKLTIVHEMAHQWFGNSVSESDWPHLWISEGIATWLTDWYVEQNYGLESYRERLRTHRQRIINYSKTRLAPIVDFYPDSYIEMLNPNSYQKGSWVLHMLRRRIGDEQLNRSLVEFYNRHKMGHACTEAFRAVVENISGANLEQFFDDWFYSAGHPVLSITSRFNNGRLTMEVLQAQQHKMAFAFPLDVRFVLPDETVKDLTFDIFFRRHEFIIDMPAEPADIIIDPDTWLLFEQK